MKISALSPITERLAGPMSKLADSPVSQQAQARTTRLLGKLPNPALATMVKLIGSNPAYKKADPLMQLIMAVNSITSDGMVTEDVKSSRKVFHNKVTALQGDKPAIQAVTDLSFNNRDGQPIKLRDYLPILADPNDIHKLPLIVFFHGGGFVVGDLDTHDEFCHYLCCYSGFPVLSVDYRLAPEHPAPAAVHDGIDAVIWAEQHAKALGVKPDNIIVAGDSAGGNLAATVSQQLVKMANEANSKSTRDSNDELESKPANKSATKETMPPVMQWLIYPITDNEGTYPSHQTYAEGSLFSMKDKVLCEKYYLGESKLDKADPLTSPLHGDLSELPPAYVVTAELDILLDEGETYAKKLKESGNNVKIQKVKSLPHGFVNLTGVHAGAREATIDMVKGMKAFYYKHCGEQS